MEAVSHEIPKKAVRALRARLHTVKKHLEPIFSKPLSDVYTKLPISERYELEVLLSYSLNTLYYSMYNTHELLINVLTFFSIVYLRTQGSDPTKHDVMKELVKKKYVVIIKSTRSNRRNRFVSKHTSKS